MAAADSSGVLHQFGNISFGGRDKSLGVLKAHAGGLTWKSKTTGKRIEVTPNDARRTEWIKIPRAYQLKVHMRGGTAVRFDGFQEQDKEKIASFLTDSFSMALQDVKTSVKGWNWGLADVEGSMLTFKSDEKPAFEFPISDLSNCTVQGKNEITMEFHVDDTLANDDECMVEMRMYMGTEVGDEENPAEEFVDRVAKKADFSTSGESVVMFKEIPIIVPRGRYEVEMFSTFMKLHGKTFDYKVMYSSVVQLYLLPKPDEKHIAFVVHLDPSIRQGNTFYQHLVMQFEVEDSLEVDINKVEDLDEAVAAKLEDRMEGTTYEVVSKVFKALTGKKVISPKTFQSHSGARAVRCAIKADEGYLYPLENSFFFVNKPPTLVQHDAITQVEFSRVDKTQNASSSRTFDLNLIKKDGTSINFVNIQRNEYTNLFNFLISKKVRIKNIKSAADGTVMEDDGSEEEEDYVKNRMEAQAAEDDDDDDDSEEDDEDFAPGNDSDVAEEFDAAADSDDSEEAKDDKGQKGKKKKAKEDASSDGGSEDGGGSGSEAEAEEKKTKKAKPSPKKRKAEKPEKPEKPEKKKKKKKDKDAPKGPLAAYMCFSQAKRQEVMAAEPELKFTEIGKKLGEMWRGMSTEDKEEFTEMAARDKARYEAEMVVYKEKLKAAAAEKAASDSGGDASGDASD